MRKRMQVRFGEDDLEKKGVVTDISVSGVFIECRNPPAIGTTLHLHLLDRERDFYVEGVVRRLKKVDPKLRRIEPEGMGVQFLTPEELVLRSVPRDERTPEGGDLVIRDRAQAQEILANQLAGRVLLLPDIGNVEKGAVVEFEILAAFADNEEFEGSGRVVQRLATGQIVVEVRELDALREWLGSRLA